MWSTRLLALLGLALFTISWQTAPANGANILGLFTSSSPSHLIVHMSVMKALAEQGHNVTVVSSMKPIVSHERIHHIVISPTQEQEKAKSAQMSNMATKKNSFFSTMRHFIDPNSHLIRSQYDILKDERFIALYDYKFDLLIIGYFANDFTLAAAAKLKCPVIINWMGPPMETIDTYVGNPREVAYVPSMNMAVKVGERMNFVMRIKNCFHHLMFKGLEFLIDRNMVKMYNELLKGYRGLPSYYDMKKNISLVFCNNHFTEGPIRPYVPALVEIGGIQIKDKPDPLPQDIEEFLSASNEHGAILLSLGSNIKSTTLKPEIIQAMFKTLSNLKQNVIWKWEDLDKVPGNSTNILYKKWLPQDDILAHPNLKLFITHAGKGGIAESQYHGVPMLALPIFGDQMANADKLRSSGYGLSLELQKVTETTMTVALRELLINPVYAQNVKKFSQLYRDRPLTAKESVVYWSEYVIRHQGAAHMQSPLVHLNGIQSRSVDIMIFLCAIVYFVWRILRLFCEAVYNLVFRKSIERKERRERLILQEKLKKN